MNTTEKNKNLVTRFVAAMNARDVEAVASLVASGFVNHAAIPEAQGIDGLKAILGKLFKAMPDMTTTCEDLIAEGDKVMCRLTVRGTQTGPLEMTRMPLPATGREVSTEQIHVFRIEGDKVAEHWVGRDDIGMLRQLGHLPTAQAVA